MKTSRIRVNDLEISFLQRVVESPSVTIVFIHGFPLGKEIWQAQLEELPEHVQGFSYDIRGYGESNMGHGYFSIDLFAKDLICFIEQLNLKPVVLCGVSMGGYIALRAYELKSELFSGLILCDTNANADTNAGKVNRFESIEKIREEGKGAFANDFLKKALGVRSHKVHHELVNSVFKLIMALPDSTICASQLALASRTDTTQVLGKVVVPTLIIRGEEDQLMSKQQAEDLKAKIAGSELVEVPEAGHLPNLENPAYFNRVMTKFLSRI